MHAAISEVGVLYATAMVHAGWQNAARDGLIKFSQDVIGGHAFAIVAYDRDGFWIQNSWGTDWGKGGFGKITYDEWLANGTDVWVARLGAPVKLAQTQSIAAAHAAGAGQSARVFVSGAAAAYRQHRQRRCSAARWRLRHIARRGAGDLPGADTRRDERRSGRKHVLLYAHGGLVAENSAAQRVAEYRKPLLDARRLSGRFHLENRLLDDHHEHPPGRSQPPPPGGHPRFHQGFHARPARRRARAGGPSAHRQSELGRDEGERGGSNRCG